MQAAILIQQAGILLIILRSGTVQHGIRSVRERMVMFLALTVYNNNLYAGGVFDSAGGNPANYIAEWNGTSWSAVGAGTNNYVNALTVYNGNLYAGGYFTTAGGTSANGIAEWNGTTWDSVGAGVGGDIDGINHLQW